MNLQDSRVGAGRSPEPASPAGADERDLPDRLRSYLRAIVSRETAVCVLLGVAAGVLGSKLGLEGLGVTGSVVIGVVFTRMLEERVRRWRTSRIWLLTFLFGVWETMGKVMSGLRRGIGLAEGGLHQVAAWQGSLVTIAAATSVTVATFAASEAIVGSSPLSGGGGSSEPAVAPQTVNTFDGASYDLAAVGDFVLVRDATGALEVQGRLEPDPARQSAEMLFAAVAVDVDGDPVTITAGTEPSLRIDGEAARLADGGDLRLPGDVEVQRLGSEYIVSWPDGTEVSIDAHDQQSLEVHVSVPQSRQGTLSGLLGNFDGDSTNDVTTRAGDLIEKPDAPDEAFQERVNEEFADSWRAPEGESLFD